MITYTVKQIKHYVFKKSVIEYHTFKAEDMNGINQQIDSMLYSKRIVLDKNIEKLKEIEDSNEA